MMSANLPEGIIVRFYSDHIDLLSAMIIGPKSTPYEDGLFVFDIMLPPEYPYKPPLLYYYSHSSDRLNPNLYTDGKVSQLVYLIAPPICTILRYCVIIRCVWVYLEHGMEKM